MSRRYTRNFPPHREGRQVGRHADVVLGRGGGARRRARALPAVPTGHAGHRYGRSRGLGVAEAGKRRKQRRVSRTAGFGCALRTRKGEAETGAVCGAGEARRTGEGGTGAEKTRAAKVQVTQRAQAVDVQVTQRAQVVNFQVTQLERRLSTVFKRDKPRDRALLLRG